MHVFVCMYMCVCVLMFGGHVPGVCVTRFLPVLFVSCSRGIVRPSARSIATSNPVLDGAPLVDKMRGFVCLRETDCCLQ